MFRSDSKQTKDIHVALTAEERAFIDERAKSLNKTISAYIRWLLQHDYESISKGTNNAKE